MLPRVLQLSWLNIDNRYSQFIAFDIFKFHNDQFPDYSDEISCPVSEQNVITHSFHKKIKLLFRKAKLRIKSLSYMALNTWNSLPINLKPGSNVSYFKHYIKEYLLKN